MQVAFTTLGCKVNQFDTNVMQHLVKGKNHTVVSFDQWAEIYVINTCTVTQKSNYQSRQLIRKAVRQNPDAKVIVTGCYAETHPDEILEIPGVDFVFGNGFKTQLLDHLEDCGGGQKNGTVMNGFEKNEALKLPLIEGCEGRRRIFLKIQDGCNYRCSFCIIPKARGPSRSLPAGGIIKQINRLTGLGYHEIVLTGVYLGAYGKDLSPRISLSGLLLKIAEHTDLTRIRLSSLDPRDFTPELVQTLIELPIVCHHLHIPIQSGDDEILQKMRRGYTVAQLKKLLLELKNGMPDVWIGTDIMVGFPGEFESHFQRTKSLLESSPVTSAHVFPFSIRPGTPAENMRGQVSPSIKQERAKVLRNLSNQKEETFKKDFVGRTLPVILLETENPFNVAISGNYLKIHLDPFERSLRLKNEILKAKVTEIKKGELFGKIV